MRLVVNGTCAELFLGDQCVLRISSDDILNTEVLDSTVINVIHVNQVVGKNESLIGVTVENIAPENAEVHQELDMGDMAVDGSNPLHLPNTGLHKKKGA